MRTRALLPLLALGLGLCVLAATPAPAADKAEKPDADKIAKLIKQLGSDDFDDREKATKDLDAVGAPALDGLRDALKSSDEEVRKRAETLVARIEKRMESANALTAKRVHLVYKDTPLAEAVDDFQRKSGYAISLNDPENKLKDRKITLDTGDATFWQAFDQFCDKAGLKEADAPPAVGPPTPPGVVQPPIIRPRLPIKVLPVQPQPAPAAPVKDEVAPAPTPPAAPIKDEVAPLPNPPAAPALLRQTVRGALQAAAPGQPVAPNPAPQPAPPVAVQPGVIIAGPGVPVAPTAAAPDGITLEDGKADALPTDASSAVRIRALTKADQFGPAPDGEIAIGLRLSLEPRLQWQSVDKVTIKKAVDDQMQDLAQTTADANPMGVGAPPIPAPPAPGFVGRAVPLPFFPGPVVGLNGGPNQDVAVHLKKGDKAAKSLTELSGTISGQILGESTPIITATEILKSAGKAFKGGENGQIKMVEASKNDNGQVVIRLEFQPPADVVPANGANPVNGPMPVPAPIKRIILPANPAGAAPAAAPGGVVIGIAVAPGGIFIGPGGFNQQGANGLSLIDDKGNVIKQTGTQIQFQTTVVNGVVTTQQLYLLTFQADKGQEPSKLVYAGRKVLSVEVPFTLKDVPMP